MCAYNPSFDAAPCFVQQPPTSYCLHVSTRVQHGKWNDATKQQKPSLGCSICAWSFRALLILGSWRLDFVGFRWRQGNTWTALRTSWCFARDLACLPTTASSIYLFLWRISFSLRCRVSRVASRVVVLQLQRSGYCQSLQEDSHRRIHLYWLIYFSFLFEELWFCEYSFGSLKPPTSNT